MEKRTPNKSTISLEKNSLKFLSLGKKFYSKIKTQPLENNFLIHQNKELKKKLGIDLTADKFLSVFSGETKYDNVDPISTVYAGHQFGYFVPQLGDGRSCLIGEKNGYEISLKGAGITPYSRAGDGRAVLRSSIREYLCSQAMKGLGVASTDVLSLVGSTTEVYREKIEPGAIVTRVAKSHIRFGHFEYFSSIGDKANLEKLLNFTIDHYFSELSSDNRYSEFFNQVAKLTAEMIAHWQAVGFSHGVMNTDNMSILGLTLDYGPFGFMEEYDPNFVCNHTDHQGRYAFDQQPNVALWNLMRLADALSPFIKTQDIKNGLELYEKTMIKTYSKLMRNKFGIDSPEDTDKDLISQFLKIMFDLKLDYTNTFLSLAKIDKVNPKSKEHEIWIKEYCDRVNLSNPEVINLINSSNPKYILRNYTAEVAIREAEDNHNYNEISQLFDILSKPFELHSGAEKYQKEAPLWARSLQVSCSS
jgi:uncharacterized protein YdiU (UPF0061 family)